jgi:hypothetical protein
MVLAKNWWVVLVILITYGLALNAVVCLDIQMGWESMSSLSMFRVYDGSIIVIPLSGLDLPIIFG